MRRFGKALAGSAVRTLPSSPPARLEGGEAGLLRDGAETVSGMVVAGPSRTRVLEVLIAREPVVDLELGHVEAVVDRLREVGDPVRIAAVEGPPARVVVGQRRS